MTCSSLSSLAIDISSASSPVQPSIPRNLGALLANHALPASPSLACLLGQAQEARDSKCSLLAAQQLHFLLNSSVTQVMSPLATFPFSQLHLSILFSLPPPPFPLHFQFTFPHPCRPGLLSQFSRLHGAFEPFVAFAGSHASKRIVQETLQLSDPEAYSWTRPTRLSFLRF
jgi:hypothetical protein